MTIRPITTSLLATIVGLACLSSPVLAHDRDRNPPGRAGGPGTDWENPPGPRGGPGASPDRIRPARCVLDRDGNPPGRLGGRGTNWENRPGPAGGPGASPDRPGRCR